MGILEPANELRAIVTRRTLLPPPSTRADKGWQQSWKHLCEVYTPALVRYVRGLIGRRGIHIADPDEPADIVQSFLTKNMESGQLGKVKDGKQVRVFRAWITMHLRRFVNDYYDKKFAMRRSGPTAPEDALLGVPDSTMDPALVAFDKELVSIALRRSMERLRDGERSPTLGPIYAKIIDDLILSEGEGSPDLAARMGLDPEKMPTYKYRARKLLSCFFVGELRATVRDEHALEILLHDLAAVLP